jgi:rhamnosyltransferase
MSKPTASVAMATYNGERFLQEQLDSLARQTLLPYELVACDDGSTDGTLDILRNFEAKAPFPVHIYQNETRLGHGPNFLRAASLCSGSLIAFCDQDDVWLEQKLGRCAATIAETGSNLAVHSAEVVDEGLAPTGLRTSRIRRPTLLDAGATAGWRPLLRRSLPMIPGFACVFRSELLSQVPPVPPLSGPGIHHENWLLFASEVAGTIILLPDVLVLYRQHDRNTIGFPTGSIGEQTVADALRAAGPEYSGHASSSATFAKLLADAATRSAELRPRLTQAQRWYEQQAQSFALRTTLYAQASSLPVTARVLCSLILRGTYRARSQGGLGFKSLAKDLAALSLGRTFRGQRAGTAAPRDIH